MVLRFSFIFIIIFCVLPFIVSDCSFIRVLKLSLSHLLSLTVDYVPLCLVFFIIFTKLLSGCDLIWPSEIIFL